MRPLTRRPALVLAIAVAVIALPAAASGALSAPAAPSAIAANSTTYQDSAGENPAAPDITTLTVSNTDAGLVSFRIVIPNRATFSSDMLIALEIDTDNTATTGSPEGTDYAIEIFQGEAALFRWDGTGFTRRPGDPPFTSLLFSYTGGITIRMSAAELGNTKALKFAAFVFSGIAVDPVTGALDFTNAVADAAPAVGAGLYAYQVRITPATLVVKRVTHGKADGRQALHGPDGRGALGHRRDRAERSRDLRGACRQCEAEGTAATRGRRRRDVHVEPSGHVQGQEVPRVGVARVRGPQGHRELLDPNRLARGPCDA